MKTHFTVEEVRQSLEKRIPEDISDSSGAGGGRAYMLGVAMSYLAMVASGEMTVDQLREALEK